MRSVSFFHIFLSAFAAIFLTACAPKTPAAPEIFADEFAQNLTILPNATSGESEFDEAEFLSHFTGLWEKKREDFTADYAWGLRYYKAGVTYYTLSNIPLTEDFFARVRENANFASLNRVFAPAITTANTPLRNLPTRTKIFSKPKTYPFDRVQDSILPRFSPVIVSHYSRDGRWAFVHSDAVSSWVWRGDIKLLSKAEVKEFKRAKWGVFVKDKGVVTNAKGEFVAESRVGGLFPYTKEEKGAFVWQGERFSKEFAAKFGEFKDEVVKARLSEFLGQSYGWGGENFLRDCSLFTKEFFATFGIWLPRNSAAQKSVGMVFELSGFSNELKKELIVRYAVPYKTLLFFPGHIMLYTGLVEGEPTAMHAIWALKDKNGERHMVGKTAITSLELGKGFTEFEEENLLLGKIRSFNIISASF